MKNKEVCQLLGISRMTLNRWIKTVDKDGNPIRPKIRYTKISDNHYEYNDDDVYSLLGGKRKRNEWCVIYARVSNKGDQKELEKQIQRLTNFANRMGRTVDKVYAEVAKPYYFDRVARRGLHTLLNDVYRRNIDMILVESPDRIGLWGDGMMVQLTRYFKCRITYMLASPFNFRYKDEIIRDVSKTVKDLEVGFAGTDKNKYDPKRSHGVSDSAINLCTKEGMYEKTYGCRGIPDPDSVGDRDRGVDRVFENAQEVRDDSGEYPEGKEWNWEKKKREAEERRRLEKLGENRSDSESDS
jgi:predicted site-specific integrase-resolvase